MEIKILSRHPRGRQTMAVNAAAAPQLLPAKVVLITGLILLPPVTKLCAGLDFCLTAKSKWWKIGGNNAS